MESAQKCSQQKNPTMTTLRQSQKRIIMTLSAPSLNNPKLGKKLAPSGNNRQLKMNITLNDIHVILPAAPTCSKLSLRDVPEMNKKKRLSNSVAAITTENESAASFQHQGNSISTKEEELRVFEEYRWKVLTE